MDEAKFRCSIIGSGVAGIACAVRLAVKGFDVTVFEKNNYPGGKLSAFEKDGYRFDAGPSLFTEPQNIEELFLLAGENINTYFSYKPVPVACNYFFEDGVSIKAYCDKEMFSEELNAKTNEPKEIVIDYLKSSAKLYEGAGNIFLYYSLHKLNHLLKAPLAKGLIATKPAYILSTLSAYNKKKFKTNYAVQIFNRYATYNGSSPYKAPSMLSVIPHTEYNEGVFYPKGGMISITNALFSLAEKKGVKFNFNTSVESIIKHNNKAEGIVVNGKNIFSDVVISNADVYFTYKKLLNDNDKASKILKQERSSSAIIFYWGIKKEFPQLDLHNIFFSNNYEKEFDCIFNLKQIFDDPTVYVNITSKCEPSHHAPQGKENWFVMINVPAATAHADLMIENAKKHIIKKLNRMLNTDIEHFIETEDVLHPQLIETKTSSYLGSLYGTSSNSIGAAFLRHANFSNSIKGLYFAGGSVHPGGGIPLCLRSAKITCGIIEEDFKKWKHHKA